MSEKVDSLKTHIVALIGDSEMQDMIPERLDALEQTARSAVQEEIVDVMKTVDATKSANKSTLKWELIEAVEGVKP